jgi:diguanylate cyclase (GGDEF)-like protein
MVQLTAWSVLPLIAALVSVGAYLRLAGKSRVPGRQALLTLLALVLFWSACQFLASLLTGREPKLLLARLSYVAIAVGPVMWFLFALCYTQRRMHLPRSWLNVLSIMPLIAILLAMTNDWHHLVWTEARLRSVGGFVTLDLMAGPWLYVQAAYSYAVIFAATAILAYVLGGTIGEFKPVAGVVMAPLIVCAANMVDLSSWPPLPSLRFTTLGFIAAVLILDATVLRYGVLDNTPVLRDRVFERLTEGVIVATSAGRVVDVNQAALHALGTSRGDVWRAPLTQYLPELNLASVTAGPTEVLEVTLDGRAYDVTGSRLDPSDPDSDVVLALRDVTVRRDTEAALRGAQRDLQRLAHTDPLTGMYNRRLFMRRLAEEIERVQRHDGCLSVVIFDLDFFKSVNDEHGHATGDRVLQAVAATAERVKRASDVAARLGGEEFALLLPATDREGAWHLAQRLREAVEAVDTAAIVGMPLAITASVGVATVSGRAGDPGHLLKLADDALYQAKNGGRNRVCASA